MNGPKQSPVYEGECPCGHVVSVRIGNQQRSQGGKPPYLRCVDCGRIVLGKPTAGK